MGNTGAYVYNMGLRFKEVAEQHADRSALLFADGKSVSYAALDAASDRVASHLLAAGVKRGSVIALYVDKQPMTYAVMVAALKIGAPYVSLDTESPHERLRRILDRCQPSLVVSRDGQFAWEGAAARSLEQLQTPTDPLSPDAVRLVTGSTPAYLMFTSGSTGFPKGATIPHAAMLNLCHWARETFGISPEDKFTGVNPIHFDNSVFDFTASLFNGACLFPLNRDTVRKPTVLVERTRDCTVWFSVPSLLIYLSSLKALRQDSWPAMRAIIFGGEGFPKTELKKLYALFGERLVLWNVYGPTETTCICSAYRVTERDFEDMGHLAPLGHLAPNFDGAVMDESGKREVADGEVGELYLVGPQTALGYWNDPERTQAAFCPHPLRPEAPTPCYRSGDLVYRDAKTGHYHFAGRRDNQIKHMGYRIELEEVESALAGLPGVAQAAVIYHRNPVHGGRIVGFLKSDTQVDTQALKDRLREVLPAYMVPDELHARTDLPHNANDKVDRRALAEEYSRVNG